MSGKPPPPIVSARAHDPEVEERLDTFVFELGAHIDALQDLDLAGRLDALAEEARAFADLALELGYAPLAEAATRLGAACVEQSPEAVRKSLMDLTGLSQRVRRGHRGAA